MRHIIATLLVLGCSAVGDDFADAAYTGHPTLNPNPLTFWWYAADPTVIRPALECALTRIREATCLPVDVSLDAWHWISQRGVEGMNGLSGWTTGPFDQARIKVLDTYDAPWSCRILTHEIAQHVLRRRNDHVGDPSDTRLLAPLLESICTVHECTCFVPEPPSPALIPAVEAIGG